MTFQERHDATMQLAEGVAQLIKAACIGLVKMAAINEEDDRELSMNLLQLKDDIGVAFDKSRDGMNQ